MVSAMSKFKYVPLLVFQIVLLILFFVFVTYGKPTTSASGFEGTHVMIFVGFGFLMTFLKKYCYSALGFNWLLAALVIQWAMLCQNFFHMKDGKIYITKKEMLEADIMAATVLITFGALLGIASALQLIFIAIVEVAVGCCNLYLVLDYFQAADAGGSIAIHAYGAYFGLACSFALNFKRKSTSAGVEETTTAVAVKLDEPSYVSDVTAMIGSIFLWIYWPAFNSAIVETSTEYERAVVNTYLSLASATVVTFVMSSILSHNEAKFDMVHIQNSTLAGGVAVGAVANMHVSPGGAIAIGIGAGILSVVGYRYLTPKLTKIGILDTCGVNNLHGMPGILSGILSVIFASVATFETYQSDLKAVFPATQTGQTAKGQALMQLAALCTTLGISIIAGLATGFIARVNIFKPLKDQEQYDDKVEWELPG